MPAISRFPGIVITMYSGDHPSLPEAECPAGGPSQVTGLIVGFRASEANAAGGDQVVE